MAAFRWRRTGDLVVAGALVMLAALAALVGIRAGGDPARSWGAFAAELLSIAALLLRRSRPLPVLALVTICSAVSAAIADRTIIGPLLPAIGLYTAGTLSSWRVTAPAAVAVVGAYGGAATLTRNLAGFGAAVMVCTAAAAIGLYIGEHQRMAERASTEQRLRADQAVLAERVWIARELHDAIGHHVSLLVVQAGAVQTTLAEDHPGRPVLAAMIDGGRQAMTEMRRLVDVLRPVEGEAGPGAAWEGCWASAPGLAELPALCDRLRASGLPVQLHVDISPPPGRTAETTAYRIVQEALTNVIKHAGHVATQVRVTRDGDLLDLRVTNERPGTAVPAVDSGGQGLPSIRRRAALFGGEVFAGPVPGGGYALRATLGLRVRCPELPGQSIH